MHQLAMALRQKNTYLSSYDKDGTGIKKRGKENTFFPRRILYSISFRIRFHCHAQVRSFWGARVSWIKRGGIRILRDYCVVLDEVKQKKKVFSLRLILENAVPAIKKF